MDATTWSSRRRLQPCLLSRCSSCYRARSYSQLWVTAMDPSGSYCSLFLPCLFTEAPALCLSSGHCLCCPELGRIFQRGVWCCLCISLQAVSLFSSDNWGAVRFRTSSGRVLPPGAYLTSWFMYIPEVLSGSVPVDPVSDSCFTLRLCWLPWTRCVAPLD